MLRLKKAFGQRKHCDAWHKASISAAKKRRFNNSNAGIVRCYLAKLTTDTLDCTGVRPIEYRSCKGKKVDLAAILYGRKNWRDLPKTELVLEVMW